MKTVDARGLSCPQPVIMAKKVLDTDDEVVVLVSERSSAENVAEMARRRPFLGLHRRKGRRIRRDR